MASRPGSAERLATGLSEAERVALVRLIDWLLPPVSYLLSPTSLYNCPMLHRRCIAVVLTLALATSSASAFVWLSKEDADRFNSKLNRIVAFGSAPVVKPASAGSHTTEITDAELNAYFRFYAKDQIPVGIVDPTINAVGDGRLTGRAVVDLDAVRTQKQRGWLDPLGYLTGRLPITVTGNLTTKEGIGKFNLEAAEISGVTIPKSVLQELLSYYSRTKENPAGINMDDPFELPARIREIRVTRARAVIVQ